MTVVKPKDPKNRARPIIQSRLYPHPWARMVVPRGDCASVMRHTFSIPSF
ncbi:MAG: hypothetical protein QNI92_03015 [Desulfobacterales bacterium]|nr:hypothetical protein [Desulfobacterales bacterium]